MINKEYRKAGTIFVDSKESEDLVREATNGDPFRKVKLLWDFLPERTADEIKLDTGKAARRLMELWKEE